MQLCGVVFSVLFVYLKKYTELTHNERCHKLSGIDFTPSTIQRHESLLRITQEFFIHTERRISIRMNCRTVLSRIMSFT